MTKPDITARSTHAGARLQLYEWLHASQNSDMFGRPFVGIPGRVVNVRFADRDSQFGEAVHLGSYNYSGLNGHPKVLAGAVRALTEYGPSTSGVRLLNGTTPLHVELEAKLANLLGVSKAVTYSSGYAANLSVISALCDSSDVVLADELSHTSLIDGVRLARAQLVKYRHCDMPHLRSLLEGMPLARRKFIVTDGVFSMDGDLAPLPAIVDLANKFSAYVVLDDAHGTGAVGPEGRGTAAHFGLQDSVDVLTGSLSKGLPGVGGFAAGNERLCSLLRYGSNGYIFSASLPPSVVGGLIAAVGVLEESPAIQTRLHYVERRLREGIIALGLNVLSSETPIIPILMNSRGDAFRWARLLHERGFYVNPVCFPAVSRRKPRLRLNASAALTDLDVDRALEALREVSQLSEGVASA